MKVIVVTGTPDEIRQLNLLGNSESIAREDEPLDRGGEPNGLVPVDIVEWINRDTRAQSRGHVMEFLERLVRMLPNVTLMSGGSWPGHPDLPRYVRAKGSSGPAFLYLYPRPSGAVSFRLPEAPADSAAWTIKDEPTNCRIDLTTPDNVTEAIRLARMAYERLGFGNTTTEEPTNGENQ